MIEVERSDNFEWANRKLDKYVYQSSTAVQANGKVIRIINND